MTSRVAPLVMILTLTVVMASAVAAQAPERTHRIGWLSVGSSADPGLEHFRDAMRERGYRDERALHVETRYTEGREDRLRTSAADLVALKVDVIVTLGTPAAIAAKAATSSIPIVIAGPGDPVAAGLVASLARPGGNVTGVSAAYRDIAGKCVELLKHVVPTITRVGFVGNTASPTNRASYGEARAAGDALGVTVEYFSATRPEQVGAALAALKAARSHGVVVSGDAVIRSRTQEIVEFFGRARIPAVYFVDEFVDAGGLMSYGPSSRELPGQVAVYVDKILKGARPVDLPIQQPVKISLVVNLKTVRALGLTIPQPVLLRADRTIE